MPGSAAAGRALRLKAAPSVPLAESRASGYSRRMLRTFTVEGIVLLTDRFGEIHKRVTLYTEQRGLLSVIAHGACKPSGKLKSVTEPFLLGRFQLYLDPVKESMKITDAECLQAFFGLRRSLRKFYSASLFAEIVLKSFGGGEAARTLYGLLKAALYSLEAGKEENLRSVALQFLLRFLNLTGFELRSDACEACGRPLDGKQDAYFLRRGRGFVCSSCRREGGLEFSPGARAYYRQTRNLTFEEALAIGLSERAADGFKRLLFLVVQESLERELTTLDAAKGVL